MTKFLSSALIAGAMTMAATSASAATTLTFSNACGGICADADTVSQNYGDVAGVLNMSYRSVASNGSTTTFGTGNARTWSTGYGDLSDVIWGAENGALEIAFSLLDPTKKITLNSVQYAGWDLASVQTKFGLYSFASAGGFYVPLLASGAVTAPGTGHATWSPNYTSASGFILHFGPDGYLGGIDNLTFTISDINAVTPVPEAATWLSMILGFGVVGSAMRRRTSLRSAVAVV